MPKTALARTLQEIGQRIREARQRQGRRQEDIAHRADIDYKRYQRIEKGSVNVTVKTLIRVADALDTDFSSLTRKPATK